MCIKLHVYRKLNEILWVSFPNCPIRLHAWFAADSHQANIWTVCMLHPIAMVTRTTESVVHKHQNGSESPVPGTRWELSRHSVGRDKSDINTTVWQLPSADSTGPVHWWFPACQLPLIASHYFTVHWVNTGYMWPACVNIWDRTARTKQPNIVLGLKLPYVSKGHLYLYTILGAVKCWKRTTCILPRVQLLESEVNMHNMLADLCVVTELGHDWALLTLVVIK